MIKVLISYHYISCHCSKGRQYINNNRLPFQTLELGRESARLYLQRLMNPKRAVGNVLRELQNSERTKGMLWYLSRSGHECRLFSYQHVGGTEIVLAGHALFQLLRHLLDILNLIQQVQYMLMFNSFNPQFPKLIPFAVQQHLAWKQILFDLQ